MITAIAKTFHYWEDHVCASQQNAIEALFAQIESESRLIQPAMIGHDFEVDLDHLLSAKISAKILETTGLMPWHVRCDGSVGVFCPSVKAAIWMMRALVVNNVVARREGTVLFVPVDPANDPSGDLVPRVFSKVHSLAHVAGVL